MLLFIFQLFLAKHHQRGGAFDGFFFLLVGAVVGGAGQGAGGEVYLTMNFLAVPLAKRAT